MSRVINSDEEALFASDNECSERRQQLIDAGILIPANKNELVQRRDGSLVVSTKQTSKDKRHDLINSGMLNIGLCNLFPEINRPISKSEEGEFKSRSIKTDLEYQRRKAAYFRIMQEVLFSRTDLNLILGKKENSDPDWYF